MQTHAVTFWPLTFWPQVPCQQDTVHYLYYLQQFQVWTQNVLVLMWLLVRNVTSCLIALSRYPYWTELNWTVNDYYTMKCKASMVRIFWFNCGKLVTHAPVYLNLRFLNKWNSIYSIYCVFHALLWCSTSSGVIFLWLFQAKLWSGVWYVYKTLLQHHLGGNYFCL